MAPGKILFRQNGIVQFGDKLFIPKSYIIIEDLFSYKILVQYFTFYFV